jgi:Holliday junction resolvase RusA-like endonuclease
MPEGTAGVSHGIRVMDVAWQAYQAGVECDGNDLGQTPDEINAKFRAWWKVREEQNSALPACDRCGFDPGVKVTATWSFLIERDPPSLNRRVVNAGATAWRYRRERTAWGWELRNVRLLQRIPLALGRRRLTLTRVYHGRQKERDHDNLVGGLKVAVDAIAFEGLIVNDSPQMVDIAYKQEPGRPTGLRVLIEELSG